MFRGTRAAVRILVQWTATNPWTFVAITVVLSVVAITACLFRRGRRCAWTHWWRSGRSRQESLQSVDGTLSCERREEALTL